MITVVVVLVLLLLLCVSAVVADRMCAGLAERRASEYLSEPFGRPPTVRVHGTPFLTQALRGRYRDVEVSGDGLRLGEISDATLTAHLYDVDLPPRELLGGFLALHLPGQALEGAAVKGWQAPPGAGIPSGAGGVVLFGLFPPDGDEHHHHQLVGDDCEQGVVRQPEPPQPLALRAAANLADRRQVL